MRHHTVCNAVYFSSSPPIGPSRAACSSFLACLSQFLANWLLLNQPNAKAPSDWSSSRWKPAAVDLKKAPDLASSHLTHFSTNLSEFPELAATILHWKLLLWPFLASPSGWNNSIATGWFVAVSRSEVKGRSGLSSSSGRSPA